MPMGYNWRQKMNIELRPYQITSKTSIVISAVATAVGLLLMIKCTDVIALLLLCWIMPLMGFVMGKGHDKRSMMISDDEIKCINSARVSDNQLAFGGYIDSLTIRRNDITGVDTYFHGNVLNLAASTNNLLITTNDGKHFIIDGRILDIKAVRLALDGRQNEAEERINKQASRIRIFGIVCNAFICVLVLVTGYALSA